MIWSKLSVSSRYVRDEATYALKRKRLVPVKIEEAELPFRFEGLHTPLLIGWDGSREFQNFRRLVLVDDISVIVKPSEVAWHRPRPSKKRLQSAAQSIKKAPTVGTVIRDTLNDGSPGPEMVVVPAGTFKMGDVQGRDNAKPVHNVRIAKPLGIGRYPITFAEYDRFVVATSRPSPNDQNWGRGCQPVINVSWDDAVKYAKWLSTETGERYRLPTETEWEFVARGGTETEYWWGNEMKSGMAKCMGSTTPWGGKQTVPVGSFQPNPFGLYDTAGNVWEWVEDCWHENYNGAPSDGRAWKEENGGQCGQRVIRGGSWFDSPVDLRSAYRNWFNADTYGFNVGFRLAQDIE